MHSIIPYFVLHISLLMRSSIGDRHIKNRFRTYQGQDISWNLMTTCQERFIISKNICRTVYQQ